MIGSVLSGIAETLFVATGHAILKFFGWEGAAELVGALVGLGFIAIGFTLFLLGH